MTSSSRVSTIAYIPKYKSETEQNYPASEISELDGDAERFYNGLASDVRSLDNSTQADGAVSEYNCPGFRLFEKMYMNNTDSAYASIAKVVSDTDSNLELDVTDGDNEVIASYLKESPKLMKRQLDVLADLFIGLGQTVEEASQSACSTQ
jgi:hypothetical protein